MEGERGKTAILNVSRSLPPLDLTNFKRRVLGETGEVSKYDQPLHVNYDYALMLEKTGALVIRGFIRPFINLWIIPLLILGSSLNPFLLLLWEFS
ncbi:DUF1293 family protein [Aliivibrio salmonicida]|uniref:DUF1293 family protein n=1 Tax=Aliivibrio salmonicida TaxID=40269 RepID=UPI000677ABD8